MNKKNVLKMIEEYSVTLSLPRYIKKKKHYSAVAKRCFFFFKKNQAYSQFSFTLFSGNIEHCWRRFVVSL